MQEFGDFVFPSGKMIVIKEKQIIDNTTYTEEEQEINLKRCKRLAFYGKDWISSQADFFKTRKYVLIYVQKSTKKMF